MISHRRSIRPLRSALAIGLVIAGCGTPSETDPERVWKRAQVAFAEDRPEDCERDLELLATLRSPTPADAMLRAQFRMSESRNEEAVADLKRVPDADPLGPLARVQEGQLNLRLGRARAAEASYRRAIALNPKDVTSHRELIYLYGIQSRWKEMGREFQALGEVAALTPEDVVLWCLSRSMAWEPLELRNDLERFLKADPEDRDSRLSLAANLRRNQAVDEAEALLKSLPETDDDARSLRVEMALDRGDLPRAEALLAGGGPDHPGRALVRGRLALAQGDREAATRWFRVAVAADSESRDALNGLGTALALAGDPAAAEPFRTKAREYDRLGPIIEGLASKRDKPTVDLIRSLGATYARLGRVPEATAWYRLLLTANPLDAGAQKALFELESKRP